MLQIPNLILIGGNSRNIGKTTITEELIRFYKSLGSVYAFKVTSIYPGDKKHHGNKDVELAGDYLITKETNLNGPKDTSRMLRAGADEVSFIMVKDHVLNKILELVQDICKNYDFLICESLSLRKIIEPKQFILVKNPEIESKKSFIQLEEFADRIVISNGKDPSGINDFLDNI